MLARASAMVTPDALKSADDEAEDVVRYFFDIDDGAMVVRDDEGVNLANIEAARDAVVSAIPGIVAWFLCDSDLLDVVVHVRDRSKPVLEAHLSIEIRHTSEVPKPVK